MPGFQHYVSVKSGTCLEGGRAGSAATPPPWGDGMTPSLTVMLANAKF